MKDKEKKTTAERWSTARATIQFRSFNWLGKNFRIGALISPLSTLNPSELRLGGNGHNLAGLSGNELKWAYKHDFEQAVKQNSNKSSARASRSSCRNPKRVIPLHLWLHTLSPIPPPSPRSAAWNYTQTAATELASTCWQLFQSSDGLIALSAVLKMLTLQLCPKFDDSGGKKCVTLRSM